MVLIKEIEIALKPKKNEVVAQEDEILADSVLELANTDFTQADNYEDITPGTIRKHVEADMRVAYPGKPTSRKRIFKGSFKDDIDSLDVTSEIGGGEPVSDQEDIDEDDEFSDDLDQKSGSDIEGGESDVGVSDDDEEVDNDDDEEVDNDDDEDGSNDSGGSIADFESYLSDGDKTKENDDSKDIDIFSARARDLKQDIEKGRSIRNQMTIWEKLIECRIKLQPALIGTNKLFQCESLKEFKRQLNSEEEEIVTQTYSVLSDLMKALLELQDLSLNASPEYREMKNLKRKTDNESDEEPKEKKKKNVDFLQEINDNFKPFKDAVIQKWNEKTRMSHGRMSKSDFSAFDQPTLKQIEEILLDRERLLRRTRTKRSEYQILGKTKVSEDESTNKDASQVKDTQEYDPEIFDDDDFYHKLLRDFIENKTSDSSNLSKRGKQWLELQKLRSRMKAKVDTRASKGRKIRFTVHNKMVNFMAPIPSYNWSEEAKNELFKSLFGQAIIQKG